MSLSGDYEKKLDKIIKMWTGGLAITCGLLLLSAGMGILQYVVTTQTEKNLLELMGKILICIPIGIAIACTVLENRILNQITKESA